MNECGSCAFWSPNYSDELDTGRCRRYPPTIIPLTPQQLLKNEDLDVFDALDASVFPETCNTEWCGEFRKASLNDL